MSSRGEPRDLSAERPLGRPPAELIACAEPQARGTDASVEFVRLMRTRSTLGDGALRLTRTRSTLGGGPLRLRPAGASPVRSAPAQARFLGWRKGPVIS